MKRTIIVVVLVSVMIFLGYSLVNNRSVPFFNVDDKPKTVVLITKMKYGDYWKNVLMGAEAAEKEFGIDLIFDAPNEENDIDAQIELVEFYIRKNVDAIVIAASDYEALVPVIEKAHNSGIRVNLIDSHINSDAYYKSFSTDNYEAGRQAGQEIIKHIGEKGSVGVVSFVEGSSNAMEREEGLKSVLDTYPDVEILDTMYCMSSIELAETYAMIFLDQKADVIVGLNAIASNGVGRALIRHHDAVGIAFDNTEEEIMYLDKGYLDATIVQNPYGMGYLGVKYAVVKDDAYTEKDNYIDTVVITTQNMFNKENQKLVVPFNVD